MIVTLYSFNDGPHTSVCGADYGHTQPASSSGRAGARGRPGECGSCRRGLWEDRQRRWGRRGERCSHGGSALPSAPSVCGLRVSRFPSLSSEDFSHFKNQGLRDFLGGQWLRLAPSIGAWFSPMSSEG